MDHMNKFLFRAIRFEYVVELYSKGIFLKLKPAGRQAKNSIQPRTQAWAETLVQIA